MAFLKHSNLYSCKDIYDYEGDFIEMWDKQGEHVIETYASELPDEFERFKEWADGTKYGKFDRMQVAWLTNERGIEKTDFTGVLLTMIVFFGDRNGIIDITRKHDNVTKRLKIKDGDVLTGNFNDEYAYKFRKQKGKHILMMFEQVDNDKMNNIKNRVIERIKYDATIGLDGEKAWSEVKLNDYFEVYRNKINDVVTEVCMKKSDVDINVLIKDAIEKIFPEHNDIMERCKSIEFSYIYDKRGHFPDDYTIPKFNPNYYPWELPYKCNETIWWIDRDYFNNVVKPNLKLIEPYFEERDAIEIIEPRYDDFNPELSTNISNINGKVIYKCGEWTIWEGEEGEEPEKLEKMYVYQDKELNIIFVYNGTESFQRTGPIIGLVYNGVFLIGLNTSL